MDVPKSVMVAYASLHGSTEEIAGFIAARLRRAGLRAQARRAGPAADPTGYAAVIVGSAVHHMDWMPQAEGYLHEHAQILARRPLWLFSVGLRDSLTGPIGRLLAAHYGEPRQIPDARHALAPRDHRVFSGVVAPDHYPPVGRLVVRAIGGRYGDFRDWDAIGAWTDSIACELTTPRHRRKTGLAGDADPGRDRRPSARHLGDRPDPRAHG
ncbi:flavodoxin domain-containing protein [Thermomonospora cellulosilytica]|uniref:Menaquinone-dependent protoporphyrinogen oxidase n=1 Tax=Thermomonospora cellulosilytica TaxID=1411118 RepID=A0A7W3MVP6_9ACTN|nr:flavodoxin domain-containing protein [Thermomonospora cellulosilytica]MBA9002769.1 menaquinone-dependent protoporphyrinogen oxidase [Thermomonospora cellulosilytica]